MKPSPGTPIIESLLRDERAFLDATNALHMEIQKNGKVSCPFHEDNNPSGSVFQEEGIWKFRCHSRCNSTFDLFHLREKLTNISPSDQMKEIHRKAFEEQNKENLKSKEDKPKHVFKTMEEAICAWERILGTRHAVYTYTGTEIELVALKILKPNGKKDIRPVSPHDGGWVMGAPPKPWPIYNRSRVKDAQRIVVVEGEKCVHALHALGIVATTSPFGYTNGDKADWSLLSGKDVILWPDNDASGVGTQYIMDVRRMLCGLAKPPRMWLVNEKGLGLPDGGDCADLIEQVPDKAMARDLILAIMDDAQPLGASVGVAQIIEDAIAGKRKSIAWPWQTITNASRALLPGTITLLCGDPGCGKSFFLLQAAIHWKECGESIAVLEMEEDRTYHLHRALAILEGNANLFDEAWIAGHPTETKNGLKRHERTIDDLGMSISDTDKPMALTEVAEWVESRAKAGIRIIAVDPITAAVSTDKPWIEDLGFIRRIQKCAKAHGASIILVIHPKKGQRGKILGLDDIAGGAAYQRFSQSVLWLQQFASKTLSLASGDRMCNRALLVMKCRNGPGHGARVALNFDGISLRFSEHGIVVPRESEKPEPRYHHNHEPNDREDYFK